MKIRMLSALSTAVLSALSLSASATTLNLAIDLSGSNPLIVHPNFAYVASQYVAREIAQLRSGDTVRVQSFGARSDAVNLLDQTYVIGRRQPPQAIASVITQLIRSLPKRQDIAQNSTNILAFIEFHPDLGCKDNGKIILLSDGLESSSTVDAMALAQGKVKLPKPDVDLTGCTVSFFGMGAGLPAENVKHIRNAWKDWMERAGASSFNAVIR